jgi:hypothetical protein
MNVSIYLENIRVIYFSLPTTSQQWYPSPDLKHENMIIIIILQKKVTTENTKKGKMKKIAVVPVTSK